MDADAVIGAASICFDGLSLCIVGLLGLTLVPYERHLRLSAFIGGYSSMAEAAMGEVSTIELFDGWRATFEPLGVWLGVRLHPPAGSGQWQLAEGLWTEIHRRGATQVVLEMDEVSFFSSALMAELVRLHKRIAVAGGRLRLSGLQQHPHEALHMLRLDEVLHSFPNRAAAIQEP